MLMKFETTKSNQDAYGKNSCMEYLESMMDARIYGTEYNIIMLCEFLHKSIDVYSSSLVYHENNVHIL